MIKVKVIENFSLGKFNELKNIVRSNPKQDLEGRLFVNDTFECTEEMAEYLTKTNAQGKPFVEVMEIIPEELKEKAHKIVEKAKEKGIIKPVEELFKEEKETKPKRKKTTSKKTIAKEK